MSAASRDLEKVRSELRRFGYLDHGLERFLLQDALKPRRTGRTLLLLAVKVGTLVGVVVGLVLAFVLAVANGNLEASPFDLVPLFLHLFPPIALGAGVGFLALCGVLVLLMRVSHVRRIEAWSLAAALAAGAALLAVAVSRAGELLADSDPWQVVVLALATPLAIFALVRAVSAGLLSLAIALADAAPRLGRLSRRWLAAAVLAGAFLLVLPALLVARHPPAGPPATIPESPGDRVLVVGIDGVLPAEVDYLLARGELPSLGHLAAAGGVVASYRRPPGPPASFWTSVATGVPGSEHGVTALDSFRPLGVRTALARSGPLRPYWSDVEVPLGLAEHRPVLANRRRAFTVWELAARGGRPVAVVNWWGTFPARPLPGLVVAHGAYQLLGDGVEEAVAPAAARPEVEALRAQVAAEPVGEGLPAGAASSLSQRALAPDRFYRRVFEASLARRPRAAALYLPALDIAADGWRWGDVAFADLVRAELGAADALIGRTGADFGTIAVVLDPGRRRAGGEGRLLLWRRAGCAGKGRAAGGEWVSPEAVASGLLRALGLPQSAELPPPPTICPWPSPPAELASFGEPWFGEGGKAAEREGAEYLESLRSLGYL